MQNKKGLWIFAAILIVLGFIFFSTGGDRSSQNEQELGVIKIGTIGPLTGDAATYGVAMQKAYDFAVAQINEQGGVDGRVIELIHEDAKCNGTDATTATQKLLNVDQVRIILGTCSGEMLAAAQLTQVARALLVSPTATSPDITNAGDLVYRTYPSDAFDGSLMADYAFNEAGYKRVAVISENTDFAQGVSRVFISSFIKEGGDVSFDEQFNTGNTDFRTLLVKMKASTPDVVYLAPQTGAAGELILKQLKEAGIDVPVLGVNAMLDREAYKAQPELYEGLVLAEVDLNEEAVLTKVFLEGFEAKEGVAPEFPAFSAAARDAIYLIAQAIQETDSQDAEGIARWFDQNVKNWPGALGNITFDENGDTILELSLVQVRDGVTVPLERGPADSSTK